MKKMFFIFLSLLLLVTLVKAQGVDTLSIRSRVFNTNRKIKISLPAGFITIPTKSISLPTCSIRNRKVSLTFTKPPLII